MKQLTRVIGFIAWFVSLPLGLYLVFVQSNWLGLIFLAYWSGGAGIISIFQTSVIFSPALFLGVYVDFKGLEALPYMLIGIGSGLFVLAVKSFFLGVVSRKGK